MNLNGKALGCSEKILQSKIKKPSAALAAINETQERSETADKQPVSPNAIYSPRVSNKKILSQQVFNSTVINKKSKQQIQSIKREAGTRSGSNTKVPTILNFYDETMRPQIKQIPTEEKKNGQNKNFFSKTSPNQTVSQTPTWKVPQQHKNNADQVSSESTMPKKPTQKNKLLLQNHSNQNFKACDNLEQRRNSLQFSATAKPALPQSNQQKQSKKPNESIPINDNKLQTELNETDKFFSKTQSAAVSSFMQKKLKELMNKKKLSQCSPANQTKDSKDGDASSQKKFFHVRSVSSLHPQQDTILQTTQLRQGGENPPKLQNLSKHTGQSSLELPRVKMIVSQASAGMSQEISVKASPSVSPRSINNFAQPLQQQNKQQRNVVSKERLSEQSQSHTLIQGQECQVASAYSEKKSNEFIKMSSKQFKFPSRDSVERQIDEEVKSQPGQESILVLADNIKGQQLKKTQTKIHKNEINFRSSIQNTLPGGCIDTREELSMQASSSIDKFKESTEFQLRNPPSLLSGAFTPAHYNSTVPLQKPRISNIKLQPSVSHTCLQKQSMAEVSAQKAENLASRATQACLHIEGLKAQKSQFDISQERAKARVPNQNMKAIRSTTACNSMSQSKVSPPSRTFQLRSDLIESCSQLISFPANEQSPNNTKRLDQVHLQTNEVYRNVTQLSQISENSRLQLQSPNRIQTCSSPNFESFMIPKEKLQAAQSMKNIQLKTQESLGSKKDTQFFQKSKGKKQKALPPLSNGKLTVNLAQTLQIQQDGPIHSRSRAISAETRHKSSQIKIGTQPANNNTQIKQNINNQVLKEVQHAQIILGRTLTGLSSKLVRMINSNRGETFVNPLSSGAELSMSNMAESELHGKYTISEESKDSRIMHKQIPIFDQIISLPAVDHTYTRKSNVSQNFNTQADLLKFTSPKQQHGFFLKDFNPQSNLSGESLSRSSSVIGSSPQTFSKIQNDHQPKRVRLARVENRKFDLVQLSAVMKQKVSDGCLISDIQQTKRVDEKQGLLQRNLSQGSQSKQRRLLVDYNSDNFARQSQNTGCHYSQNEQFIISNKSLSNGIVTPSVNEETGRDALEFTISTKSGQNLYQISQQLRQNLVQFEQAKLHSKEKCQTFIKCLNTVSDMQIDKNCKQVLKQLASTLPQMLGDLPPAKQANIILAQSKDKSAESKIIKQLQERVRILEAQTKGQQSSQINQAGLHPLQIQQEKTSSNATTNKITQQEFKSGLSSAKNQDFQEFIKCFDSQSATALSDKTKRQMSQQQNLDNFCIQEPTTTKRSQQLIVAQDKITTQQKRSQFIQPQIPPSINQTLKKNQQQKSPVVPQLALNFNRLQNPQHLQEKKQKGRKNSKPQKSNIPVSLSPKFNERERSSEHKNSALKRDSMQKTMPKSLNYTQNRDQSSKTGSCKVAATLLNAKPAPIDSVDLIETEKAEIIFNPNQKSRPHPFKAGHIKPVDSFQKSPNQCSNQANNLNQPTQSSSNVIRTTNSIDKKNQKINATPKKNKKKQKNELKLANQMGRQLEASYKDFQDEFMGKYDEFSQSWRDQIDRERRF